MDGLFGGTTSLVEAMSIYVLVAVWKGSESIKSDIQLLVIEVWSNVIISDNLSIYRIAVRSLQHNLCF